MSSNFPFYDNNTFGIDSVNQFTLSAFNPYGLYHYTVTIVSPNFPEGDVEEETVAPEVTFQDFLTWCGSYVDIDSDQHVLFPLAKALINLAKDYIDVDFIGEASYKRVVSLYVGHYLELHIKMLKDEAQTQSMNPEVKDKIIKLDPPMGSKEDFRQTISGTMFWSIYGSLARFAGKNDKSIWGAF
jgi:hypothetical protein